MTAQEFTDVIKKVVQQSSVADTISNLNQPPGRHPSEEIIMLSEFYKSLDENQKSFVDKIMDMVAETTLFGLLCVIDGVRAIEGVGEKGELGHARQIAIARAVLRNRDFCRIFVSKYRLCSS